MATRVIHRRRPELVEPSSEARRHVGSVSFPELVWAHFLWQREVHEHGILHGEAEEDFQRLLRSFERGNGQIQHAYWCTREASAVAITAQRPYGRLGEWLRLHPVVRFHAVTSWVTRDQPDIAGLLHRCEAMSVKFTELLRHGTQQIAMEWLLAIAGHLLGSRTSRRRRRRMSRRRSPSPRNVELAQLEAYYRRAGEESGRIVYFWGMMIGIAALGIIGAVGAGLLWQIGSLDWHAPATQNLFASYTMGAVGAVVSVLSRMASGKRDRFYIDFEVGRPPIRRVASFRPFIGAVFALVLYFALLGNLVQLGTEQDNSEPLEYYAVLSFFAGFSERWVRGVLSPVAALAGGDEDPAPASGKHKEET